VSYKDKTKQAECLKGFYQAHKKEIIAKVLERRRLKKQETKVAEAQEEIKSQQIALNMLTVAERARFEEARKAKIELDNETKKNDPRKSQDQTEAEGVVLSEIDSMFEGK